jgi:hypothetical protein
MGARVSQQVIHVIIRLNVLPNKWNDNLSQVVGWPPSSVLVAPQRPPKNQGINQVCSHVKSIIQGGAHVVQCIHQNSEACTQVKYNI